MRFKNICFDLDGTLTDSREGILNCLVHALQQLNQPVPRNEHLISCIGPPLRDCFAKLIESDDTELIEKAVEIYRERFSTVGLFENQVYDGIPDLLQEINVSGKRLLIITGKPEVYAMQIIEYFKMDRFFQEIYGSHLNGRFDDKKSLVKHVIVTEKLDPKKSVMVGDRKHDILAARRHHISPIGVLWGFGSKKELEQAGAEVLCDSPAQLIDILNK